jgi:uncharacterized membrane protein YphA (DoxX/SURF4 family)
LDEPILIARLALAVVFAVAAIGKLGDLDGSRQTVERFGVPARFARPVGVLIPLAELAIAVGLLIAVATVPWAALAAALLLAVFCAAIVRVLARGEAPECNCFGSLGSAPVGRGTLARNVVLIGVAGFVAVAGWSDGGISAWTWIGDLDAAGGIAVALAVLMVAHLAFSWQLFRQNGRLLDRVSRLEAGHTHDAKSGLPIGEPAPRSVLPDLDGHDVVLDDLLALGRGALLVFTDPACGHCDPLLPGATTVPRQRSTGSGRYSSRTSSRWPRRIASTARRAPC